MRVGIAGLGKMGSVFADRIKAAGHELAVWNRTPAKAKAVTGATVAASPADLASRSQIVLTIVSDDAAVTELYEGAGGLLSGEVAGRLFVEMSTVRPATHVRLAKAAEAAGGRFIECPVGGSVKVASEGRLLGFAGGEASDVDRARPVLEALCRRIDHAGPVGAGAALNRRASRASTAPPFPPIGRARATGPADHEGRRRGRRARNHGRGDGPQPDQGGLAGRRPR